MSLSGPDQGTGGDSFGAMVALLADPNRLQAKYADLAQRQKAAEDAVALVGPAQDVLRLRDEAQADREAAAALLADANTRATGMVERAAANAAEQERRAEETAQAVLDHAGAAKAEADASIAQLAESRSALATERQALDKLSSDLEAQRQAQEAHLHDLAAREEALAAKVAKLDEVRQTVAAQLAEHIQTLNE